MRGRFALHRIERGATALDIAGAASSALRLNARSGLRDVRRLGRCRRRCARCTPDWSRGAGRRLQCGLGTNPTLRIALSRLIGL
ncbi:MAG: hypothetical protein ABI809_12605, partial [Caldimonas sp.]